MENVHKWVRIPTKLGTSSVNRIIKNMQTRFTNHKASIKVRGSIPIKWAYI